MILADKIMKLRKQAGWSQEDLALKLEVSRQSVSKWESASSIPDLNRIISLADIFGVSTDYLLKDEVEETLFGGLFEKYGGLDFHHATQSSDRKEVAVFSCRGTDTGYLFGLTVETEPPHGVRGITIAPLVDVDRTPEAARLGDEEIAGKLSGLLAAFEKRGVFSGVVLLAKGEAIVFHEAFGWARREEAIRATTDTRFNLASLGKMFTAVAIAQLEEKGLLSFDDPIGKHLGPDWVPPALGRAVKIKHLLSHTSGIGGGAFNITYVEEAVDRGFTSLGDYRIFTERAEAKFEPGSAYEYSNLGYHLLGAIVERVSGKTYADYMQSHVFAPAGMDGACLDGDRIPASKRALGYEMVLHEGEVVIRDNRSRIPPRATPAGLGYATARDLQRFAQALRRNTLVSASTRDTLFDAKPELHARRYGYGFRCGGFGDRRTVGHTGGYIGINNAFSMGRDDDYTVVILSNIDILTGTVGEDLEILIEQMLEGP